MFQYSKILFLLDRPECKLYQTEDEGQIKLTCEAKANPSSVAFSWSRGGNVSQSLSEFEVAGLISTYIIEAPSELDFGKFMHQKRCGIFKKKLVRKII